jgi:hypothetical protein
VRHSLGVVLAAFATAAVILVAACVGDDPASPPSATPDGGGAGDTNAPDPNAPDSGDSSTGPACDRSKAFGAPVAVTSLNTDASESQPWLSPDGLTVHFTRREADAGHLWTASRPTRDADFGTARRLDELVTTFSEKAASLTADGLYIYFASDAPDGGNTELYASTRANVDAAFGTPVRLVFSSVHADETPHVLPDNTALYSSVRGEVDGGPFDGIYRLYRSDLPAGPRRLLDTPPHIPGYEAIAPVVTPDETMLVFSAIPAGGTPPFAGYKGLWDILTSRREKKSDPWGAPVIEAAVNTPLNDFPHWISPDGCELWLDQDVGAGKNDIFVARRPK